MLPKMCAIQQLVLTPVNPKIKASCWDCQNFYIGNTKRTLHDRKTEHLKGITSACHASAIAEQLVTT